MFRIKFCAAALLYSVASSRSRKFTSSVGGVPVYNHHLAQSSEEAKKFHWNFVLTEESTDDDIAFFCEDQDCIEKGHPDEGGVRFFTVRAFREKLLKVVVKNAAKIEFIEPEMMTHVNQSTDDEGSEMSWNLREIGADMRKSSGKGVHIHILDTGVRTTHSEFGGRAKTAWDAFKKRKKSRNCLGETDCAVDNDGHGTHCGGSAAGETVGVAPEAQVYAVKVINDKGYGTSGQLAGGIDWVISEGERPAVISISIGGPGHSGIEERAIDAAIGRGVTVVVAAGNEGENACNFSPSYIPSAITVGATNSSNSPPEWSNYGKCVDIWAPGVDIRSGHWKNDKSFRTWSGTSMACPHVAGAVALILQNNPIYSPSEAETKLMEAAKMGHTSNMRKENEDDAFLSVSGL